MVIRNGIIAAALVAGLAGATAMAAGGSATNQPVACEITARRTGDMIALKGSVRADDEIAGEYRFRVMSIGGGGTTNISQGGGFTLRPDEPTTLGTVMLVSAGMTYEATLDVTAGGVTITCAERFGAAI